MAGFLDTFVQAHLKFIQVDEFEPKRNLRNTSPNPNILHSFCLDWPVHKLLRFYVCYSLQQLAPATPRPPSLSHTSSRFSTCTRLWPGRHFWGLRNQCPACCVWWHVVLLMLICLKCPTSYRKI